MDPTTAVDLERENLILREELRRARAELQRLDQVKRDLVQLTERELRRPLATLIGFAKTLQSDTLGSARDRAAAITSQASQLKNTVDAMITLQQLDAGELALRFEIIALRPVVISVVESREREIRDRDLNVRVSVDADLSVCADRDRLELILSSLLATSIRHSPNRGTILLQAHTEADWAVVSLYDDRAGMSPEMQSPPFEEPQNGEASSADPSSGSHLGLTVAKALVELHEGRIWLESSTNRGSRVYFSLPRANRDAAFASSFPAHLPVDRAEFSQNLMP